jgi:hypothetical protein
MEIESQKKGFSPRASGDDSLRKGVPLDDFIASAVMQAMRGISKASYEVASIGGVVNPRPYEAETEFGRPGPRAIRSGTPSVLEFDLAIAPQAGPDGKITACVVGGSMAVGIVESGGADPQGYSRFSFRVPVRFPFARAVRVNRAARSEQAAYAEKAVSGRSPG